MRDSVESEVRGFMKSRVILTAAELDLFSRLDNGPLSASELSDELKLDERAFTRLLDCLVALDYLKKEDDCYQTTEEGSRLSSAHKQSILPSVRHMIRLWNTWSHLTSAVREGNNSQSMKAIGTLSDEERLAFIGAMDVAARELAREISQRYNTTQFHRMMDVGGGSGAYTIAFLKRNPKLQGIFFDLPSVIPMAQENVRRAELEERVNFVPGDFYVDELPEGCDLVLLSAIIHQNSLGQNLLLFKRIHGALESKGTLLIRDFVMDASRTKPVAGTLFALNMLVGTDAGDTYTFDEIKAGLMEAGFREVELMIAGGSRMEQLVQARK